MKFLRAVRRVGGRDTDIEIPYSGNEDGGSQSLLLASKTLQAVDVAAWATVGFELLAPSGDGNLIRAVKAWAIVHRTGTLYAESSADIYLADDAAFNTGSSDLVIAIESGLDTFIGIDNALWMSRLPTVADPVGNLAAVLPSGGGGMYVFGNANLTVGDRPITIGALYTVIPVGSA